MQTLIRTALIQLQRGGAATGLDPVLNPFAPSASLLSTEPLAAAALFEADLLAIDARATAALDAAASGGALATNSRAPARGSPISSLGLGTAPASVLWPPAIAHMLSVAAMADMPLRVSICLNAMFVACA